MVRALLPRGGLLRRRSPQRRSATSTGGGRPGHRSARPRRHASQLREAARHRGRGGRWSPRDLAGTCAVRRAPLSAEHSRAGRRRRHGTGRRPRNSGGASCQFTRARSSWRRATWAATALEHVSERSRSPQETRLRLAWTLDAGSAIASGEPADLHPQRNPVCASPTCSMKKRGSSSSTTASSIGMPVDMPATSRASSASGRWASSSQASLVPTSTTAGSSYNVFERLALGRPSCPWAYDVGRSSSLPGWIAPLGPAPQHAGPRHR